MAEREGVVQNSTDQRERLKETVHELETARADHQTAIADGKKLSSELDTARGEIETLTARIADLEPQAARIPELESGRDTLQAQLDERAKELSSASGRGEELSTELQQRQDTIASFERTIEESTRTIESLRANQTRLEADLADARDRASSLQATVDEFNTLRGKTAALEDSHAAAVEESRMLLKDASRRSGQVKELETEILTLRNELNARVQDVAKRTAEIEKLQDEITVFKEREADREEANRELDSLIAKASELDELRASSIQTNATLERVLREIEGVREEHATTTAELKAAERRLEIVEEEDQRRLTRGEAKGLRRQVKELKARNETYTKLSEKLRGLRDEVFSALGPEVREEKGPVDVLNALRETRGQAYARMDQLEERLSITLDEKAELQLELTAINHTLSGSMGKLESFQRRADDAEQRLAELVKERTFIDSRVEEAIGQRTADTQRISDLENLLKANGAEAAHAENKALREELDRMQGAFDEAGNRMVALLEQVKHQSAFQEQLVKATRRVSILENEIVDLQSDLEEKRMQLAEANLRLDMEKKS